MPAQPVAIITGGAGFIGSHLTERIVARGWSVRVLDDLSTGRRENLEPLLDAPGARVQLIHGLAGELIRDPAVLRGVDRVFHLAAAVGVKLVVEDPAGMIRNNVDETLAVLEACTAARLPVLLTSSSEVYGKCPTLPLREDMELVYGPTTASRWSYGLTKALDEHLAIDYARRRGLQAVIVRLFNTIGPRQVGHYGMVVPRFVTRALAAEPLEIYGDGLQTRAFCDARDVAVALDDLLDHPPARGKVFNVGSETQVTILDLARLVLDLTGSSSTTRLVPYEAVYGEDFEDPPHRLPDVSRLRQAVGFSPSFTLEQTLRAVIEEKRHLLTRARPREVSA